MSDDAECFNCRHYRLKPHDEWKPRFVGEKYIHYDLMSYLREKGHVLNKVGWPGTCQFSPMPVEVRSTYRCSGWACDSGNHSVSPKTTTQFMADIDHHREVAELRAQLKQERERSLERFRKLKQLSVKAGRPPPQDDGDHEAAQLKH